MEDEYHRIEFSLGIGRLVKQRSRRSPLDGRRLRFSFILVTSQDTKRATFAVLHLKSVQAALIKTVLRYKKTNERKKQTLYHPPI